MLLPMSLITGTPGCSKLSEFQGMLSDKEIMGQNLSVLQDTPSEHTTSPTGHLGTTMIVRLISATIGGSAEFWTWEPTQGIMRPQSSEVESWPLQDMLLIPAGQ